jgi:cellulose biosynthesis protein BcsQ
VLREKYGELVLSSKINKRVNISESPAFKQPITEYDPESQSAQEFKAVGKEILKRIKEVKNG